MGVRCLDLLEMIANKWRVDVFVNLEFKGKSVQFVPATIKFLLVTDVFRVRFLEEYSVITQNVTD